jgi:hypothetical protein
MIGNMKNEPTPERKTLASRAQTALGNLLTALEASALETGGQVNHQALAQAKTERATLRKLLNGKGKAMPHQAPPGSRPLAGDSRP